jgi:hypothetical protein
VDPDLAPASKNPPYNAYQPLKVLNTLLVTVVTSGHVSNLPKIL